MEDAAQACGLSRDCPVCGRAIFVTGGVGSFGRAFAETLLTAHEPARVTLYSRGEHAQAEAARALSGLPAGKRLRMRLGDVRDYDRLRVAIDGHEVVVHAAALKVLASGLLHPDEMVKTNVNGTLNVLRAACDVGALRVLTISSDKACAPVNLYGQSKAIAEGLTVGWSVFGYPRGTWFAAVRYGNVMGSRGSVVHVFRRQIREGKPLTITDERMTRFWITLPEAVTFVLSALQSMRCGEIFIPKLPAARIVDLAAAVMRVEDERLFCIVPALVGATPGEKTHEDLLSEAEVARAVDAGPFVVLEPAHLDLPRPKWQGAPAAPMRSDGVRMLSVEDLVPMVQVVP